MLDPFPLLKKIPFPQVNRKPLQILQLNLGYKCNLQCVHCHVNAGPKRTEIMSADTIESVLEFVKKYQIKQIDLTGGAPEMHPQFKQFIIQLGRLNCSIIVRTNLVILAEPEYQNFIQFMANNNVTLTASLPCYLQENVDKQRGKGTFDKSIAVLQSLNKHGYGTQEDKLQLNLVFNPQGAELPGQQQQLEAAYKDYLLSHYQIVFNKLLTISNQPIKRFGSMLMSKNEFTPYMQLLQSSFEEKNLDHLMCKTIVSVDWQGYVYDCDFNQMLDLPIQNNHQAIHISSYHPVNNRHIPVQVAGHCYACTAAGGSSCGGALS